MFSDNFSASTPDAKHPATIQGNRKQEGRRTLYVRVSDKELKSIKAALQALGYRTYREGLLHLIYLPGMSTRKHLVKARFELIEISRTLQAMIESSSASEREKLAELRKRVGSLISSITEALIDI